MIWSIRFVCLFVATRTCCLIVAVLVCLIWNKRYAVWFISTHMKRLNKSNMMMLDVIGIKSLLDQSWTESTPKQFDNKSESKKISIIWRIFSYLRLIGVYCIYFVSPASKWLVQIIRETHLKLFNRRTPKELDLSNHFSEDATGGPGILFLSRVWSTNNQHIIFADYIIFRK